MLILILLVIIIVMIIELVIVIVYCQLPREMDRDPMIPKRRLNADSHNMFI